MFPVRYELTVYILFKSNSVFKGLRVHHAIYMEEMRETTKQPSQDSHCSRRDRLTYPARSCHILQVAEKKKNTVVTFHFLGWGGGLYHLCMGDLPDTHIHT
jgi:hypothetical protein